MDQNAVFVVFNIVSECGAIVFNRPNCLFGTKGNNTLHIC